LVLGLEQVLSFLLRQTVRRLLLPLEVAVYLEPLSGLRPLPVRVLHLEEPLHRKELVPLSSREVLDPLEESMEQVLAASNLEAVEVLMVLVLALLQKLGPGPRPILEVAALPPRLQAPVLLVQMVPLEVEAQVGLEALVVVLLALAVLV